MVRRRACETEPHHCGARAEKSEKEDGAAAVGVADAPPEEAGEQAGEIVSGGKGAREKTNILLGDAVVSDHVRHHRHQEGDDDAVSQCYQQQQRPTVRSGKGGGAVFSGVLHTAAVSQGKGDAMGSASAATTRSIVAWLQQLLRL